MRGYCPHCGEQIYKRPPRECPHCECEFVSAPRRKFRARDIEGEEYWVSGNVCPECSMGMFYQKDRAVTIDKRIAVDRMIQILNRHLRKMNNDKLHDLNEAKLEIENLLCD